MIVSDRWHHRCPLRGDSVPEFYASHRYRTGLQWVGCDGSRQRWTFKGEHCRELVVSVVIADV